MGILLIQTLTQETCLLLLDSDYIFLLNENAKHFSHTPRIFICINTFLISSHNKIGLNRDLTKISRIEFWRGRPISRQSFRETEFLVASEEASYMILSLVVSADFLMAGPCRK